MNTTFDQWVVPHLHTVKYQDAEETGELISFAIGGGGITEDSDADGDGLKDYQELIVYGTYSADPDKDDDGMPDGWEVFQGTDAKSNDATDDLDGDRFSNLIEYLRRTDPDDPNSHPSGAMPWMRLLLH